MDEIRVGEGCLDDRDPGRVERAFQGGDGMGEFLIVQLQVEHGLSDWWSGSGAGALGQSALGRAEAERNTDEEMNTEIRSLVMSLLTGMPGGSGVGGMRPTDEQMLQEVGMEREKLLQKVPRFVMEGAGPDQKTVVHAKGHST